MGFLAGALFGFHDHFHPASYRLPEDFVITLVLIRVAL
jgi:hypothetical protein